MVHSIPLWLEWAEMVCALHVDLPRPPINQFKPMQQSRQQAQGAYCPNLYTMFVPEALPIFMCLDSQ